MFFSRSTRVDVLAAIFRGIGISLTLATACCFAVAQQQSGPQGGLRCLKVSDACTYRPGYHYTSPPTITGRRLFFFECVLVRFSESTSVVYGRT
jgi:hypothetical protein